jgi:hypothetical protein
VTAEGLAGEFFNTRGVGGFGARGLVVIPPPAVWTRDMYVPTYIHTYIHTYAVGDLELMKLSLL